MVEEWELQQERDDDLISRYCHKTWDKRNAMREWLVSEIKDLKPKMEYLLPTLSGRPEAIELKLKLQRLVEIDSNALPERLQLIDEVYSGLKAGASSDLIEDLNQMNDMITGLQSLIREIRDARVFVYRLWTED